jgi:RimJ/RimL family protein N-acetyltransferase
MILAVYDQPEAVAAWTGRQLGIADFGPCKAIGIVLDGVIVAGIVYSGYRPEVPSMEMSVASVTPRWLSRNVLHDMFAYPFLAHGVYRVQSAVAMGNKHARRFVERLGAVYEGKARKAGPRGVDMAVYSILRHECRWIGEQDGEAGTLSARRA